MRYVAALSVLLVLCFLGKDAPAQLADSERCPGMPIDVSATTAEERRLTCMAAAETIGLLGRCGISARRPLRVQIQSEVRRPRGEAIFGMLDVGHDRVLVTHQSNIPALVEGTPYARLPQRDFYKSLIVHEIVHGIMHQNLKRAASSHAAYEYPAYALQIESFAPQVRDVFLQSFDQSTFETTSFFNDPILFFDPYHFAARAYRHFKASANGCAHLAALLEGEVAFILAAPQMQRACRVGRNATGVPLGLQPAGPVCLNDPQGRR
jgi:hypothetical protein